MTHNKESASNNNLYPKINSGAERDPFVRHHGSGQLENKDYTKFIKWTPLKVSIASLLLFTPYAALVYAIASATSIAAVIPLLVAPALIAVFAGIIYWLSKAVL